MYPLAEGMFAPKNQWYVAAWSDEVTREPIERLILDEPIAFYRKRDGSPVALHGRCPHRSFPLGRSRVVDDNIQCGYHGIMFGPDGSCKDIPSQPQIPKVCQVASYPLVERWKWIWIWPGDPTLADESLLPDHFELGLEDPSYSTGGNIYNFVPGRYMLLHDNLFDLTHIGYLHMDTFGKGAEADQVPNPASGANWVESLFEQIDIETPPVFRSMFNYEGRVDRKFGLRLHAPCLHEGGEVLYTGSEEPEPGKYLGTLKVFHAITPATKTTTHYFWGTAFKGNNPDPESVVSMMLNSTQAALDEDIMATKCIEETIQRSDTGRLDELLLRADNVCVLGRRMMEKLIRAEAEA